MLNGLEREKGRLHAAGPFADGQGLLCAGWVIFGNALAAVDDMTSSAPVAIKTTAFTRRTAEVSSARCRYVVSAPGAAKFRILDAPGSGLSDYFGGGGTKQLTPCWGSPVGKTNASPVPVMWYWTAPA